jgi:hypothetical protein
MFGTGTSQLFVMFGTGTSMLHDKELRSAVTKHAKEL